MSVYSNHQIEQAIKQGIIVCHPFQPEHLNRTSLDVTLGHYYLRISAKNIISKYTFNGLAGRVFDGPQKALTHKAWCELNGRQPVTNIPLNQPVISLAPNERILAHSHEFLGVFGTDTAQVRSRANWPQNGIFVESGTGQLRTNGIARCTLELYNANHHATILLPVGERIAQVVFWHGTQNENRSTLNATQSATFLEETIQAWTPAMIAPEP